MVTALVAAVVFGVGGWLVGTQFNAQQAGRVHLVKKDHPHGGPKNCKGQNCTITITFDCDPGSTPAPDTCIPYPDQEAILVGPQDNFAFKIDPHFNQFKFDPNTGIQVTVGIPQGPGNNFPCAYKNGNFECSVVSGTPPGLYKYMIQILNFDRVDPWIVNG
jgi:hypothetical protein